MKSTLPIATFVFLLAVSTAAAAPGIRVFELPDPAGSGVGFSALDPAKTGLSGPRKALVDIDTQDQSANSGLSAGDVDGDGLCDLFLCGLEGENFLYRNLGGWRFRDVTAESGLSLAGRVIKGSTLADIDGDDDLDLLVFSLEERNAIFLNDGKGGFSESRNTPWIRDEVSSDVSGALADIDGDGDLDLYVTKYGGARVEHTARAEEHRKQSAIQMERFHAGLPVDPKFAEEFEILAFPNGDEIEYEVEQRGYRDVLFLNDGYGNFSKTTVADGRFRDESGKAVQLGKDWGLAAQFRDVDNDGDPDLYVCNDFYSPDRFWINDGRGSFRPVGRLAVRRTSVFSMSVDFADINRDGQPDFFTVDMLSRDHTLRKTQMGPMKPTPIRIGEIDNRPQIMQNTLHLNRGDGTWAEIAQFAGVKASEWSWGSLFLDVDLDGYEDLLVVSGMVRDYMDADINAQIKGTTLDTEEALRSVRTLFPSLPTQNFVFHNQGNLRFADRSLEWGLGRKAVSGGIVAADFDNDGDLDVAINNMDGPPEIYRNETTSPRVAVRLRGKAPNTRAIGARLRLAGGIVEQTHEVTAGGHFASSSDTLRVFSAKGGETGMRLEILWRGGGRTVIEDVRPNRLYEIDESTASPFVESPALLVKPWFEDVSARLNHVHHEAPFDDFLRQSLLPNRLSQLGPGLAWHDLDGDGDEDLAVGAGAGGSMSAFLNDGRGQFARSDAPPIPVDQTGLAAWGRELLVGMSNFETGATNHFSGGALSLNVAGQWRFGQGLAGDRCSAGPLATADVDGDGDLDLFVGGRTVPGRHPETADSRLFLNQGGVLIPDPNNGAVFRRAGLVSGAVFGDLDGDADPDLVLACEWGPPRVFRNEGGAFTESTRELGLGSYPGWWNGVSLGDFDNDGRLDIVASNWGRNSKYEGSYSALKPLEIYHGDFDNNGTLDIVEAHFDKGMNCVVPERGYSCSSHAMPFIRAELGSYRAFGVSPLTGIYGNRLDNAEVVRASALSHMVFLNRGKRFEGRELPPWSQLAPALGVNVADFDGDGNEDVFLSQNFFSVQVETPRNDGGRGLWLKGDGKGSFVAVKGQESGVLIYGEQRGSALCDFDGDGRVDLAVAQNGAATRLFRNVRSKLGLRVRLRGPRGNPRGVGAVIRLEYENGRRGPARPVMAGSGYWSQDSLTQVMGQAGVASALHVRWPDGSETRTPVNAGVREAVVDWAGEGGSSDKSREGR